MAILEQIGIEDVESNVVECGALRVLKIEEGVSLDVVRVIGEICDDEDLRAELNSELASHKIDVFHLATDVDQYEKFGSLFPIYKSLRPPRRKRITKIPTEICAVEDYCNAVDNEYPDMNFERDSLVGSFAECAKRIFAFFPRTRFRNLIRETLEKTKKLYSVDWGDDQFQVVYIRQSEDRDNPTNYPVRFDDAVYNVMHWRGGPRRWFDFVITDEPHVDRGSKDGIDTSELVLYGPYADNVLALQRFKLQD